MAGLAQACPATAFFIPFLSPTTLIDDIGNDNYDFFMSKVVFFIGLFLAFHTKASDDCLLWFSQSKITPTSPGCEMKCSLLSIDLATASCPSRCGEFCRAKITCKHDSYWVGKIKDGLPSHWPIPEEKVSFWTASEKEALLTALDQLPDDFKLDSVKGFFRMKKSMYGINPGTQHEGEIVLYDSAFDGPFSLGRVLAHELAHQWFSSKLEKLRKKYRAEFGWKVQSATGQDFTADPNRKFVAPDAQLSPDEDFANNVDTFLFDIKKLENEIPKAIPWIKNNFSSQFKLKDQCNEQNKK